jgi:hypothetical protein
MPCEENTENIVHVHALWKENTENTVHIHALWKEHTENIVYVYALWEEYRKKTHKTTNIFYLLLNSNTSERHYHIYLCMSKEIINKYTLGTACYLSF